MADFLLVLLGCALIVTGAVIAIALIRQNIRDQRELSRNIPKKGNPDAR